jgi:hypothetical protein
MTPTERLLALWDHLGIGAAHVATQMPGDIAPLASAFSDRLAGVVLCVPTRLDPAARAESRLPRSRRIVLVAGRCADILPDALNR